MFAQTRQVIHLLLLYKMFRFKAFMFNILIGLCVSQSLLFIVYCGWHLWQRHRPPIEKMWWPRCTHIFLWVVQINSLWYVFATDKMPWKLIWMKLTTNLEPVRDVRHRENKCIFCSYCTCSCIVLITDRSFDNGGGSSFR